MIAVAAIHAPMMSCSSIWFPLLSWGLSALSLPIVGAGYRFCHPPRRSRVFHAQFAGAVDKTHRIQACLCLVICLDVCKDSLIGKGETLQTEGGNKMARKSVVTVKELRDLAAGMKINLVVAKRGSGVINVDCDSEIDLKKFMEVLELALIQGHIDSLCPTSGYVSARFGRIA